MGVYWEDNDGTKYRFDRNDVATFSILALSRMAENFETVPRPVLDEAYEVLMAFSEHAEKELKARGDRWKEVGEAEEKKRCWPSRSLGGQMTCSLQ